MAILGIDEVGRGPLAGPLVVGAVILPERGDNGLGQFGAENIISRSVPEDAVGTVSLSEGESGAAPVLDFLPEKKDTKMAPNLSWIDELKDSKKLTPKKREKYATIIMEKALATGLGWVTTAEIDEIGISEALRLAVRRAIKEVQAQKIPFTEIIIDGKINFLTSTRLAPYVSTLVKADDLIKEVSAASIIAKVARDRYMIELARRFPEYAFEKNMGYGTAVHLKALRELGPCPEHRRSFEPLKSQLGVLNIADKKTNSVNKTVAGLGIQTTNDGTRNSAISAKNTTVIGNRGETAVAEFLVRQGHQIVVRNYKTKTCEIDLVSILDDQLYFTEVKYRKTHTGGSGLEAITKTKLRQMEYAAQVFLAQHPKYHELSPILAAAAVTGENFAVEEWVKIV